MFSLIKECGPEIESSWNEAIYITFDIDWCHDDVLLDSLELISSYGVKATFFATHETTLLHQIESNYDLELGMHPNFNQLLNGDFRYGSTFKEVFDYYRDLTPTATSARSHSLTQSSHMLNHMVESGITHESNLFIPHHSNISLKPWKHWNSALTRVPYFWGDDIQCITGWGQNPRELLSSSGLKVFDFHPIHIFLNTDSPDRYNAARPYFKSPKKLKEFVNTRNAGARDFLINLIESEQ